MMQAWCFLASVIALVDGIEMNNLFDLFLAVIGISASFVFPPIVALGLAFIIWGRVSLERPIMPTVAAGTLALCILAL